MRKIVLSILFVLIGFAFTSSPAHAIVATNQLPENEAFTQNNIQGMTGHPTLPYVNFETMKNTGWGLYTLIFGNQRINQEGAMVPITNGIAYMYKEPGATTQTYVADVLNSAGLNIAQPAYAQGFGFGALTPILDSWKVFRNLAYLFYVILFLIIGFMIMFRQKMNGQAVVTAQQAIPKIIISLLAVTFSYAIAGLLIDIMYVIMFLLIAVFSSVGTVAGLSGTLKSYVFDKNIFEISLDLFTKGNAFGNAYEAVGATVVSIAKGMGSTDPNIAAGAGIISGLTFAVVFALASLYGVVRLFFELLKTYVSILIAIVLSPLALMLGALPGNNAFSAWIKTLVANLAVFPVILFILILSYTMTGQATAGITRPAEQGGFLPPYIFGGGNVNSGSLIVILGLGTILIMPDIVIQVKKSLGGSGGIFEQFANNFFGALKKGWQGGELIPGMAASNLSKYGLTGQNAVQKAGIGAAVGVGAISGLSRGVSLAGITGAPIIDNIKRSSFSAGRRVADLVDDKNVFAAERKERKEGKVPYDSTTPSKKTP